MLTKKRIGRTCVLLGSICVLIAAALVFQNSWAEKYAAQASVDALAAIALQADPNTSEDPSPAEDSATIQSIAVEDSVYCGVLSIDSLGLTLPIQTEFSYPNLKSSPCLYPQEGYDAIVIAAHNYNSHFGSLPLLSIGDSLCYTPIGQDAIYYTVSEMNTVDASDLNTVQGTADELILFTCNINDNTQRVVVRCQLTT